MSIHDARILKRKSHVLALVGMLLIIFALPVGGYGCQNSDADTNAVGDDHNDNDDHMMGDGMMDDGMMGDGMMGDGMMGDGMMGDGMMGDGMMDGDMPGWMMSHGDMMGGSMMRDMRVIRRLLMSHEQIDRTVEDIPGGVRTETTSSNPELASFIRTHVRQMKQRVEKGQPIRMMDPLFREIFEHNDEIDMQIEDIEGGVRVIETSDNPQVTLLIRQHAKRAVSEFVDEGMPRAMEPTPLPEGYESD